MTSCAITSGLYIHTLKLKSLIMILKSQFLKKEGICLSLHRTVTNWLGDDLYNRSINTFFFLFWRYMQYLLQNWMNIREEYSIREKELLINWVPFILHTFVFIYLNVVGGGSFSFLVSPSSSSSLWWNQHMDEQQEAFSPSRLIIDQQTASQERRSSNANRHIHNTDTTIVK